MPRTACSACRSTAYSAGAANTICAMTGRSKCCASRRPAPARASASSCRHCWLSSAASSSMTQGRELEPDGGLSRAALPRVAVRSDRREIIRVISAFTRFLSIGARVMDRGTRPLVIAQGLLGASEIGMTEHIGSFDRSDRDGRISSNDPAGEGAEVSRYATCAASFTASAPAGMRNGEDTSVTACQTAFATSPAVVVSAGCGGVAEDTCFAQSA